MVGPIDKINRDVGGASMGVVAVGAGGEFISGGYSNPLSAALFYTGIILAVGLLVFIIQILRHAPLHKAITYALVAMFAISILPLGIVSMFVGAIGFLGSFGLSLRD